MVSKSSSSPQDRANQKLMAGEITLNEYRVACGLEPTAGADVNIPATNDFANFFDPGVGITNTKLAILAENGAKLVKPFLADGRVMFFQMPEGEFYSLDYIYMQQPEKLREFLSYWPSWMKIIPPDPFDAPQKDD